jgi:hypothetical protein
MITQIFPFSDSNTLVEAVEFATLGKIQPFLVTITTSAALLIDFHCHLTKNEVCGYLGGSWDVNSHSKITKLTTNWNEINFFLNSPFHHTHLSLLQFTL